MIFPNHEGTSAIHPISHQRAKAHAWKNSRRPKGSLDLSTALTFRAVRPTHRAPLTCRPQRYRVAAWVPLESSRREDGKLNERGNNRCDRRLCRRDRRIAENLPRIPSDPLSGFFCCRPSVADQPKHPAENAGISRSFARRTSVRWKIDRTWAHLRRPARSSPRDRG